MERYVEGENEGVRKSLRGRGTGNGRAVSVDERGEADADEAGELNWVQVSVTRVKCDLT